MNPTTEMPADSIESRGARADDGDMSILALAPLPVLIFVAGAAMVATGCGAGGDLGGDTTRRVEREVVSVDDVRDASGRADHRITARSDDGSIDIGVRH